LRITCRSRRSPPGAPAVPVADQTVFHITGYLRGYFWGAVGAHLSASAPSYSSMLGSVTPEGEVLLLRQMKDSSSPTIMQGIGQLPRKFRQWTMANQMFTSPGSQSVRVGLKLGHWASMVDTRTGFPSWCLLPSAGVSIPQFLAGAPGPRPVGSLA
jgi:hypothetical protein